ncbi:hypothetical protein [Streptomyces formicae]|uniref:Uncharacterized protein n=1 Tax=Streptomyces formicae TaxID=1616117 RepID=A0ABY3WWS4_9ACTN|nr:hypothetical protein [Streptomyces formicae]UNM15005.1 hypothetical protein J4032_29225 [Streptomyces formicae]
MSRYTEIIVLARGAEKVMEALTRPNGDFTRVDDGMFDGSQMPSDDCYTWVAQYVRQRAWEGLFGQLESVPWPDPWSVQVLLRDEDDDCFGLWMLHDSKLTEVPLPRTRRRSFRDTRTGVLDRTDRPGR